MNAQTFVETIQKMKGLTREMKDVIIPLAPDLTDAQRDDYAVKLGGADAAIVDGYKGLAATYEEGTQDLHTMVRKEVKKEEGDVRTQESTNADHLFDA